MNAWRLGYRPGLDGLRGVAIAMVLAGHAGWGPYSVHGIGVEVFFVLSGFLITSLLVEEWADTGRVNLPRFYLRRARRLLPALFVCLLAVAILVSAGELAREPNSRGILAGFGYMANVAQMGGDGLGSLSHLWSLSIEEHFYLVWPALLLGALAIGGARWATGLAVVLLTGSMLARWWLLDADYVRVAFGTDTRAAAMLLGALAALIVHRYGMPHITPAVAVAVAVAGAGAVWWASTHRFWHTGWTWFAVLPAASVGALALVIVGCGRNPAARVLETEPLVKLGKMSYGLYLWHYPIYALVGLNETAEVGKTVVAVAASITVASLSLRWVEMPIRTRGFLLRDQKPRGVPLPAHPQPEQGGDVAVRQGVRVDRHVADAAVQPVAGRTADLHVARLVRVRPGE